MMRLQKFLALSGVASRRNSEKLIADGHVAVNGKVITEMGVQVDESADVVTVDGKVCKIQEEKHYLAYNKPMGEVTTVADPEGRPTVMDKFRDYPVRLYPVGRLDYDSEGLLLLTNDGDLMNNLLHPSREVSKEYLVKVSNRVTDEEIRRLRAGCPARRRPHDLPGRRAPGALRDVRVRAAGDDSRGAQSAGAPHVQRDWARGRRPQARRLCDD